MPKWIALECAEDILVFRADAGIDCGQHKGQALTLLPVYNLRGNRGYALICGKLDDGSVLAHWFSTRTLIPTYINEHAEKDEGLRRKLWHLADFFSLPEQLRYCWKETGLEVFI